ncbi:MAG: hypothetical protein A2583_04365 [Bdellovibrionales bacterium RIFOXYD1_FULL_53_11]|nr:MAG: hypothetical protein A2583_04365 [Bdellovibrionales bacterium RIFOXYD1_FULL_53_11]
MFFDSHCHIDGRYASKPHESVVSEARAAGVTGLLTVSTDIASITDASAISEAHDCVWHAAGIHPHEASGWKDGDDKKLLEASKHPRCVAIGETGLDYHYDHSPRDKQRAVFELQLATGRDARKPVIIHSREAEEDTLEMLKKFPGLRGVIHCFTGSGDFGRACLDMGFYISFSGIVTFGSARDLQECARTFPLDRLLIETDAPFLAPIPMRGRKCEPSMLPHTARKIALLRGMPVEDLAAATTHNALELFGISRI